jgi:branched-chain amino acid transport system substrate-binding protein
MAGRHRRQLIAALVAGALLAPVAVTPGQGGPLRVGFLTVRTGPLAAGGRQMEEGLKLLLDEREHTLAGRRVEVFFADTGGQPSLARTRAQELVERERVDVIIGPLATFEALAIDDYVLQTKVPLITPTSAAQNDLAQRRKSDYVIHVYGTAAQPMHVLGSYAAKALGFRRVAMIADDFTYGHEGSAGFHRAFEDAGGRVVQKLWPPLNVADYGSYVAQLKGDVDAVYAGFAGTNGLRFLRTYREYGASAPVLGNPTCVDEGILRNMGDEALGAYSASWYAADLDTTENRRFVAAVRAAYQVTPGFYTTGTYVAGLWLEAALKAIDGRFEDRASFVRALHAVHLERSPMGPLRLDEYGKPILNVYVRRVERQGGHLVNSTIATFRDVSQFWTYDPKAFIAGPQYGRDVPAARHLE